MRPIFPLWLGSVADGRDNNLNLLRLMAALGVFVSHTVLVTQGMDAVPTAMWRLGTFSVWVFFAISGFLIAASFERRTSFAQFLGARCLRIFPALLVCILLTAFVIGPWQSVLPLGAYLGDAQTYRFVLGNASLFWETKELPGVFGDHPVAYAQITFWTLKHEVLCYLVLAFIGLAGALASRRRFAIVFGIALAAWILVLNAGPEVPVAITRFGALAFVFLLGAGAYVFRDHVPLSIELLLALLFATWLFWWTPAFHVLLPLTLAYGALWAGYVPSGSIRGFNRVGDYSYGLYIFGVPVQQLLVATLGEHSPVENLVYGLLPALCLAVLSWHLIEKPCLGLKQKIRGRQTARGGTSGLNGELIAREALRRAAGSTRP